VFPKRNSRMIRNIFCVSLLFSAVAVGSPAFSACQPGQMEEANTAYRQALDFLVKQDWDQAIAGMQSAIQICPEHVEATRGVGKGLMGKKQYAEAVPYFERVIELRGENVEAGDHDNLGKVFAQLKRYNEALSEYKKAVELAPNDCGVLFNLGQMYSASKAYSQAVDVMERALEVCPQYKDNILPQLTKTAQKAADQQKANGNNDRAAEFQLKAQEYGSQTGGSTTYDMVKQKMKEKDYQGAVTLLNQFLEKDPDHTGGLLTLARAQDQLKNGSASIAAYQKYLALKPNDENATAAMLQVMVENEQCTLAKSEAAGATRKFEAKGREAMAPIMYSWGLALECTGEYDAARDKFQKCASSGHARYASFGARQVERMDGLKAREDAEKKKAAQGG
jgi:tetratricopeptide (TPR) repeat protein